MCVQTHFLEILSCVVDFVNTCGGSRANGMSEDGFKIPQFFFKKTQISLKLIEWLFFCVLTFQLKIIFTKQECIPVGCVPPARYRTGGLCHGDPPDRDPPWTETPQTETPLDRDLSDTDPLDTDPLRQRPPGQRPPGMETPRTETPSLRAETEDVPPHGQTDTCENITCINFVCGR